MKFDNTAIFESLNDPKIQQDFDRVSALQAQLAERTPSLDFSDGAAIAAWLADFDQAQMMLRDIMTFAKLIFVVDSTQSAAQQLDGKAMQRYAALEQVKAPLMDALMQLNDSDFEQLVGVEALQPFRFMLQHQRAMKPHLLSVAEETLLTQMSVDGLHAWGDQYSKLAASIKCEVNGETMGLAAAFNLTMAADRNTREAAWHGIRAGWEGQLHAVIAGLNAINGWRLSEFERRSKQKPMHYLDVACHQSHITRDTLAALMDTTFANRSVGQKAIQLMSQWNRIDDTQPWDLMAPPRQEGGENTTIPYREALQIIHDAFAPFDQEMADFVMMMDEKGWIDAEPTPNRATGAFCTEFVQAGEPRVFMTYDGSMGNVLTLAHELGHAWHAWLLRDLGYSEKDYPMTLAETASIFAETLVRQALLERAETDAQKRNILWQEAESVAALMVNVPARFEFEKAFVEARKEANVSAEQARDLMRSAWQAWYEGSLTQYDDLWWASKLHFSIAELGFYNYPYTFGYLFALGVYAQKDKHGEQFRFAYRDLLRDTGRMSAEACVQKHLHRDIRDSEFWQDSINIVEKTMQQFEKLV